MKSKLRKEIEAGQREERKKQGYFDGRFAPRVHKDLKKEESRRGARKSKIDWENETWVSPDGILEINNKEKKSW